MDEGEGLSKLDFSESYLIGDWIDHHKRQKKGD